jgi:arylformamidase
MTPDEAYANSAYIPDGEAYYARWDAAAAAFRNMPTDKDLGVAYGRGARQTYDFYRPIGPALGTVVIVHGGYWLAGSPYMFSHLAAGSLGRGLACAMPSHTLCPDVRIADITAEIKTAIDAIAARTDGPLYLVGHSAGGHLVARMACEDIAPDWAHRVARVMAISPLGDLAPLMGTTMNDTLGLTTEEARLESPIHHRVRDVAVTAWVGGDERPAFLQQAKGLHDAWGCDLTIDPGRHHFDVIEGLEDATSPMMRALLS